MSLVELAVKAANNNLGAADFITQLVEKYNEKGFMAIARMSYIDVTGDKLYMLWNDCCQRNIDFTLEIMLNNSKEDILKHINYENGRGIEYGKSK